MLASAFWLPVLLTVLLLTVHAWAAPLAETVTVTVYAYQGTRVTLREKTQTVEFKKDSDTGTILGAPRARFQMNLAPGKYPVTCVSEGKTITRSVTIQAGIYEYLVDCAIHH